MPKRKPWEGVWDDILDLYRNASDPWIDVSDCDLSPNADGWFAVHCPMHMDESPSLRINTRTGGIKCMAGCNLGTNLNDLENLALNSKSRGHSKSAKGKGKTKTRPPTDKIGDLAERRMLDRDWLEDRFGLRGAAGGYIFPIDDPLVNPDIKIDYDLDGHDRRVLHELWKRGAWLDKEDTARPKYQWRPSLSKSHVSVADLVYNLHRIDFDSKHVYVVAGAPDVWVMDYCGFPAISFLAGEGTEPSLDAVDKVQRAGIKEITIIYDNDEGGQQRVEDIAIDLTEAGIDVDVQYLPDDLPEGADITDLWLLNKGDKAKFEAALGRLVTKQFAATDRKNNQEELEPEKPLSELPDECYEPKFIAQYIESVSDATDAGLEFHLFGLLNIMGSIMGRRYYLKHAGRLYAPHYTVFVGPSSISRKTTALNFLRNLLREAVGGGLKIMGATGSGEALKEALAYADCTGGNERDRIAVLMRKRDEEALDKIRPQRRIHVIQDEISGTFAKGKGDSATLVETLLEAYGCPPVLDLQTRKNSVYVYHPVLSILGTSTPERLRRSLDITNWYDGLMNRFVLVLAHPREIMAEPGDLEEPWEDVVTWFKEQFNEAFLEPGMGPKDEYEIRRTDKARTMWAEWFAKFEAAQADRTEEQRSALRRIPDSALRYAMIYSVVAGPCSDAELGQEYWISESEMRRGIAVAEYAAECMLRLVVELTRTREAALEDELCVAIRRDPGISTRDLYRPRQHRFHGVNELKKLLDAMKEARMIRGADRGWYIALSR